jgi:CheY-like chemotaxis protein
MRSLPAGPRRPLLIIEDDPDVRDAFFDMLDEAGHSIFIAKNGAEALALLPTLPPLGLVLVDLMMPVMDGAEFLARAHELRLLEGVPVFVLSAAASRGLLPGATGFLPKPVDLDDLLRLAARYCGPSTPETT